MKFVRILLIVFPTVFTYGFYKGYNSYEINFNKKLAIFKNKEDRFKDGIINGGLYCNPFMLALKLILLPINLKSKPEITSVNRYYREFCDTYSYNEKHLLDNDFEILKK